jgi:hypothetical protein
MHSLGRIALISMYELSIPIFLTSMDLTMMGSVVVNRSTTVALDLASSRSPSDISWQMVQPSLAERDRRR